MIDALKTNLKYYLMEAFGLAIFMISACFFSGLLESQDSHIHHGISNSFVRQLIMGIMMGLTALLIFYSPLTAGSGAQINPAVTIAFLRLNKIGKWDAVYYMVFQTAGGTVAVYLMSWLMKDMLQAPPVNFAVTVPGKYGTWGAFFMEFLIAFVMMSMVLFTGNNGRLKKYTRVIAAAFVCFNVIVAGPVSGFGMNPARSFSSALASQIWTAFWIYLIVPIVSMLCATEYFLFVKKQIDSEKHTCYYKA